MEKTPKTVKRKRKKSNGPENVEEKTGDGKALAADAKVKETQGEKKTLQSYLDPGSSFLSAGCLAVVAAVLLEDG